jgi:hypothetical protein
MDDPTWIHTSPLLLSRLKGVPYEQIAKDRDDPDYMTKRLETDRRVADELGIDLDERGRGFLHASLGGKTRMRSDGDYPGHTYRFGLTPEQVARTYFETPLADRTVRGGVGELGLKEAIRVWDEVDEKEKAGTWAVGSGSGKSRVEAYIPDEIEPQSLFPQQEDRHEFKEILRRGSPQWDRLLALYRKTSSTRNRGE